MNYTNIHNLPKHVCEWLMYDEYDYNPDAISATSLLKPARAVVLARQNKDIAIDVMDTFAARCGTAIHDSFERSLAGKYEMEQRLTAELDGVIISGKFDLLVDGQLRDIKQTSVWTVIYDSKTEDYTAQLSIYAWLCRRNNIEVDAQVAWIDYILRDWSATKAMADHSYPQLAYQQKQISLWSDAETEAFILARLQAIREAEAELPLCNNEELWYTGDTWAVMKVGRQSAVKLYKAVDGYSERNAREHAAQDKNLFIEFRPGEAKRCSYCNARSVCEQYRRMNNV